METQNAKAQAVIQNLEDAGCDSDLIKQFMNLLEAGKKDASLALLARHRKSLLDRCHAEEKKIDCLDYLVYQMKKNKEVL